MQDAKKLARLVDHPADALAAALLAQAVADVREGNGHSAEARRFLLSEWGREIADGLGIEPRVFYRLANARRPVRLFDRKDLSNYHFFPL